MHQLWALSFLMVESAAYDHFIRFDQQMEYEPFYAHNWLLLGKLANEQMKLMRLQASKVEPKDVLGLFERYGRKK